MSAAPGKSVVVCALGVTQIFAWASSYYLTAVFADPVSISLHLSQDWFFGAFSAALLLSGLLGPFAGRLIDRRGGRVVLAGTNAVFAAGLVLLSLATGPMTLATSWLVLGIGMGFGLYEAAFATVTGLYGREARNAITGITLLAGFASTVGWPLGGVLIETFGWRGAALCWAGLHLLIGLPLNWLLVPSAQSAFPSATPIPAQSAAEPKTRSWTMIVLAAVFGVTWFVSVAFATHLPRLLVALGVTPSAAIAVAALVGPAQVAARIAEFGLLRRASPLLTARIAAALHPVGAMALALFGGPAAILFVLLHGAGNGMLTIARGTLPLALFGAGGYGLRMGLIAAPARILQSGAPIVFGVLLDRAGPLAALAVSFSLMGLAVLALLCLRAES